jgi:hypothetical protein
MDIIKDDILAYEILAFIGDYHFRYIAGVNRQFYRAYTTIYPSKKTYVCNVFNGTMTSLLDSSIDYIPEELQLCLDEVSENQYKVFNILYALDTSIYYIPAEIQLCLDEIDPYFFNADQIIALHNIVATTGNIGLLPYLQDAYQYMLWLKEEKKKKHQRLAKKCFQWDQGRRSFCATAALHGRLEMLQIGWYFDFPWDTETCSNAALHGHWHILKFAFNHDCPWDSQTRENAEAYRGKDRWEIINWLRENGCHRRSRYYW